MPTRSELTSAGDSATTRAPARSVGTANATSGMRVRQDRRRFRWVLVGMTAALLLTITAGVSLGAVAIHPLDVWGIVAHRLIPRIFTDVSWTAAHDQIVWGLRLPRVLLGALVGGGLAVVGTALQALVRNPLADPYVFGITSGASVGATAVLIFGVTILGQQSVSAAAFLGAVVAFALVLLLARLGGGLSPAQLILAGVAVAYMMSALTSFLVFMARSTSDQGIAQAVLFWLLGSLGGARWDQLGLPAAAVVCGTHCWSCRPARSTPCSSATRPPPPSASTSGGSAGSSSSSPPCSPVSSFPSQAGSASSASWSRTLSACSSVPTTVACCRSPCSWARPS